MTIDLRQQYSSRFRMGCDPSCERVHHNDACDPWNALVLCQHGHIYPHGELLLGAATNNRGPIANSLAALPCVRVTQDGDDGINVVFDASDFAKVAAIMKPRRRRTLSPEQRAKLVAMGTANLKAHRKPKVQSDCETRPHAPDLTLGS
jgi:hypothetical protein